MKIVIDMSKLTLGDMEDFEDKAGMPMSNLSKFTDAEGNASGMPTRALISLIWIGHRANDPSFTFEDAKLIKPSELELEVADSAANPQNESD